MDEPGCMTLQEASDILDKEAPDAPLLALGQTVFWDEPLKGGIVRRLRELGDKRPFVAGVHDTDYFAKFGTSKRTRGYAALPHNDTTTKNLWSAAGEFSALFGSETVVAKDYLVQAGGKVAKVEQARPGFLDDVTEAPGWRGVVSLNPDPKITAEKELAPLFPELYDTLDWAVRSSLALVSGEHRSGSERTASRLLTMACDASEHPDVTTLADYYEHLIPGLYNLVAGSQVDLKTTRTSRLLQFNRATADRARFDIVSLFLSNDTRSVAENAYNECLRGTEMYTLDRFGTGALPFDLVIPGVGRGTLRIGNRGGVVQTPNPVGFSFKQRPQTSAELAALIEDKFGPDCVLVGKAVSLILMLAREFVFVFHEGASMYVDRSACMTHRLAESGSPLRLNPILRVKYEPWDAMADCCAWLKLPNDLIRPFGTEELSAPSFAVRWREVGNRQRELLATLAKSRRPLDLLKFFQSALGGNWTCLANEYEGMHSELVDLAEEILEIKRQKQTVLDQMRAQRQKKHAIQAAKGEHWRAKFFEKSPDDDDIAVRAVFDDEYRKADLELDALRQQFRLLSDAQSARVSTKAVRRIHERRAAIALEAEMMRLRLIREATLATVGLEKAGHRPSAWWFPLVCPDGAWSDAMFDAATYRLERLS